MTKGLIDRRSFIFSTTLLAASASYSLGWAANAKDAEVLVEKLVDEIANYPWSWDVWYKTTLTDALKEVDKLSNS